METSTRLVGLQPLPAGWPWGSRKEKHVSSKCQEPGDKGEICGTRTQRHPSATPRARRDTVWGWVCRGCAGCGWGSSSAPAGKSIGENRVDAAVHPAAPRASHIHSCSVRAQNMIIAGAVLVFHHFQSVLPLKWLLLVDFYLKMLCRITNGTLYLQTKVLSWRKSTFQQLRDAASNMALI